MLQRIWEIVAASTLLILVAPVLVVMALISLVAFQTWPFFSQQRIGQHGRPFRLLKIRTLPPDTPPECPKHDLVIRDSGRACRFLRAHHLDELPQLINVLAGSMSLVGPRPEMVALNDTLPVDFAKRRAEVRPGLTGLWQVSIGVKEMIPESPEFDLYYVANRSPLLDLWILGRTASGLLGRAPIMTLDELPAWAGPIAPPVMPVDTVRR